MAGYGTPLGYGEGLYGETFVPGGEGTVTVALDDGTGTFPHDITAYVLKAEGISFSRGRQDWQGGVTAGSMSLTLNNSDGRFTVGSTVIASPSPISMDQRVRFSETVNGTTYVRFTGYVKQWPVAWPAVVPSFATAQIVATDAQARAERRVLRSSIDEQTASPAPSAHYPLTEPSGAGAAGDMSGNQQPQLTPAPTAPTFGANAGPAAGGSATAADFTPGQGLAANVTPTGSGWSMVVYFKTSASGTATMGAFGNELLQIISGQVSLWTPIGSGLNDNQWHAFGVSWDGGTGTFTQSVDGGAATSTSSGVDPTSVGILTNLSLGSSNFTGSLSHLVLWGATLTLSQLNTATSGAIGESGTARLTRLAGFAGLSVGTLDASLTTVPAVDLTGQTGWGAMQQVADAEVGVTFVDGGGNLVFHNRNHTAGKVTPDLTLTNYELSTEVQPVVDDADLINYIEATSSSTQVTRVIRDTTSEGTHGRYSASMSYLVQTDQEALDRANWIVATHSEPAARYGTLTLNLWAMTASTAASVLANLEVGAWLQVTGFPSQTPGGTTVDVVVEGYSERISSTEWTLTLNVSDKSLTDCLILDDPTRGVLDAGYRLYV